MSYGYVSIDNYKDIPGSLVDHKAWVFPPLRYVDVHGNNRTWIISVTLQSAITGNAAIVKPQYYNNEIIPHINAAIHTTYGVDGGKTQHKEPTIISAGKNLTKRNQTNVWTQSLRDAIGLYNKRCKSVQVGSTAIGKVDIPAADPTAMRVMPMLAKNYRRVVIMKQALGANKYDLVRDPGSVDVDWATHTYWAQPKLDGVRCIIHGVSKDVHASGVELYSRGLGSYGGFDELRRELMPIFAAHPNVYLDGEIYNHGKALQKISGIARAATTRPQDTIECQYHIYDMFTTRDGIITDASFEARQSSLDLMLTPIAAPLTQVRRVETTRIMSNAAVMAYVEVCLAQKYEGVMLRVGGTPYEGGRSGNLLKLKPRFTEEGIIKGFTDGKGKDAGAIIWQLETAGGASYMAVPKGITYEDRYRLFTKLTKNPQIFIDQYLNRSMTVEYEDHSVDGVPLRAKAITVRDYE